MRHGWPGRCVTDVPRSSLAAPSSGAVISPLSEPHWSPRDGAGGAVGTSAGATGFAEQLGPEQGCGRAGWVGFTSCPDIGAAEP